MGITRREVLLGALGTLGTTVAGCAQAPVTTPPPTPTVTATPTATPTPTPTPDTRPRWPLTGQLLGDASEARHAAVGVKVPDNRNEHPQAGLNEADLVFVQLEGYPDTAGQSSTRLMPVFHSRFADAAAPVRSLRPVDVPLLAPMHALVGSTGATPWVENYVRSHKAVMDGSHTYLTSKASGAYSVDQARIRVYQGQTYYDRAIVCHPAGLAKLATGALAEGPQQPYLPFATTDAEASTSSGRPAPIVRVPWKRGATYDMTYLYDEPTGLYLRSMPWGPHLQLGGARVTTDNILVIRAVQRIAKLFAGDGPPDPVHDIIDTGGTFVYAHGGAHVTGRWSKASVGEPFRLVLDDGSPLRIAPGRTFVELPRPDADVRFT